MQVSATLIAAQQAAREARQRLALPQNQAQPASQANFAAAVEKTSGVDTGFSALPLKQIGPHQASAPAPQPAAPAQMGQHIDITV